MDLRDYATVGRLYLEARRLSDENVLLIRNQEGLEQKIQSLLEENNQLKAHLDKKATI